MRPGAGRNTLLLMLSVAFIAIGVIVASTALARQVGNGTATRDCGSVVPPLPPGDHEGYSFFKVTARNLRCGRARHVARRYVELTNHSVPPLPVNRRVLGFTCAVSRTGGLVRCRRGRDLVVGHNGGF